MDSTLIGQECIDELAARVGIGARVAAITERAMRGEIAFEPALARARRAAGRPAGDGDRRSARDRITLTPGARTLVQTMRAGGAYAAIVSGGFTPFTGAVAARLGFDEHRANQLIVEDGRSPAASANRSSGATPSSRRCATLPRSCGLAAERDAGGRRRRQ